MVITAQEIRDTEGGKKKERGQGNSTRSDVEILGTGVVSDCEKSVSVES